MDLGRQRASRLRREGPFPIDASGPRPLLCCVTRFTLISVLLRLRSMSFCKLRTLLRSPSCVALKILCLSRRTFSSQVAQSVPCQSSKPSSGPFTADADVTTGVAISMFASGV